MLRIFVIVVCFITLFSLMWALVRSINESVDGEVLVCKCNCDDLFEVIYDDAETGFLIVRDTLTDILYFNQHDGSFYHLMHPDGTLLLYSEWKEMKEVTP